MHKEQFAEKGRLLNEQLKGMKLQCTKQEDNVKGVEACETWTMECANGSLGKVS